MLNYTDWINICSLGLNVFLGIFVFINSKDKKSGLPFLLFTISVLFWGLSLIFIKIFQTELPGYFAFAWGSLVPFSLLWFFTVYPYESKLYKYIYLLSIAPIAFFIISFIPNLIFTGIKIVDGAIITKTNIFFILFLIYFVSYIFISLYLLYEDYKSSSGIKRNQILFLLLGIFLFALIVSLTNVILPALGIMNFNTIGPAASLIFVAFTSYSILAHHLFDIRVIIKKTLVYSGLLAFVLITYALIVMSLSVIFSGQVVIFGPNGVFTTKMILPNIIAAIFIALGFGPLENWLSHITDKWLFKGDYDQQAVLSKLSDNLSTVIDLNEALASMMKTITEAMRVKTAATFVLTSRINTQEAQTDANKENANGQDTKRETQIDINKKELEVKTAKIIGYEIPEKDVIEKIHPIIDYFENQPFNTKTAIITDDIKQNKETRTSTNKNKHEQNNEADLLNCLENLHIAFAMPICTKDKMIGLFILGEKLSGDMLNEKDLNLLDIAVKQTAAAIEKARFYEEDQLKSEFVSIASHELLTPTSAIEGYLSMILDEHLSKVDKKSEEYLRKVQKSAQRLALLVKDLLNVSRIEGGRIIIQWQAFDIVDLINTVIEELQPKAKEKKLKLGFTNSKSKFPMSNEILSSNDKKSSHPDAKQKDHNEILPPTSRGQNDNALYVFADEERTHQVLVNLIGNAIKYTEHGNVTVQVLSNKIKTGDGMAIISVTDSGMGMSEEDQKHLFEKFYRASNANKFGAGGTGLGLYISKNITELMGGKIWLKSIEDKGSTFYFSLKLATPDEIKNHSTKPQGDGYVAYKK